MTDLAVMERASALFARAPHPSQALLARCLSESWFSDTLAWYLDPRAEHGLGTLPAELFLKAIGKARSAAGDGEPTSVRAGRDGAGRGATSFNLGNCAVIREFFLSRAVTRGGRNTRYCDLVLIDLDHDDGLAVLIENKLFTCNRAGQLGEYHAAVEDKFSRVPTREYVYLTLGGDAPVAHAIDDAAASGRWLRLGWTTQLLQEVFTPLARENPDAPDLRDLCGVLSWMAELADASLTSVVADLRGVILGAAADCLHEELERLRGDKSGRWTKSGNSGGSFSLVHTSLPTRTLHLELLPNCSVTIQTRNRGRAQTEKILVPFGAHADQIANFLQLAARQVYTSRHFDNPAAYLSDRRRRRTTRSDTEVRTAPLFKFVHKHRYVLQVCLALNAMVRRSMFVESDNADEDVRALGTE